MKATLAGQQFPGPEDLLTSIQEFLSEIQRSELKLVFHHWLERIQWVLDNDGDAGKCEFNRVDDEGDGQEYESK
jgi:hypothetical protein